MDTKLNDTNAQNNNLEYFSSRDTHDTREKGKKLHPVKSWIAFFIAVNMLFFAFIAGIALIDQVSHISAETITEYFQAAVPSVKIYSSPGYRAYMTDYLLALNYAVNSETDDEYFEMVLESLAEEINTGNIIAYAKNNTTGAVYGTNSAIDEFHRNGLLYNDGNFYYVKPYVYVNERNAIELILLNNNYHDDFEYNGTAQNINNIDADAYMTMDNDKNVTLFRRDIIIPSLVNQFESEDSTIYVFSVNDDMIKNNSHLFYLKNDLQAINIVFYACAAYIIIMILLFVYASLKRNDRTYANKNIASVLRYLWIEVKLAAYIFVICITCFVVYENFWLQDLYCFLFACAVTFWMLYFLGVELRHNGFRRCFGKNIFMSLNRQITRFYNTISLQYNLRLNERPFVKIMKRKFINYIIFICVILFLFSMATPVFLYRGSFGAFILMMIFIALGVYITIRYIHKTDIILNEFTKISDKIISIRNGIDSDPLVFPIESTLKNTAYALNDVQSGIKTAVEEQMKSERMKIELVTNVSHDVKTPLTSLISYTELLSHCENMPEEATDYIKVLKEKLKRLTELIGNLFDLSKATSNEMEVIREQIDLKKLIDQVNAQFCDTIEETGLKFIYRTPDVPVMMYSDGAKLHRVFENLYINALKYSLEGSRVYVSLISTPAKIKFSIINVSREEIDYTSEEIMSRFVRGDKNRSTEGSGLGLAIARSFTELCGGTFSIDLDGDLFKANVEFNQQV